MCLNSTLCHKFLNFGGTKKHEKFYLWILYQTEFKNFGIAVRLESASFWDSYLEWEVPLFVKTDGVFKAFPES